MSLKLGEPSVLSPWDRIISLEPLSPDYLRKPLFQSCTMCCWQIDPRQDVCWERLQPTYHPLLRSAICVMKSGVHCTCHWRGSSVGGKCCRAHGRQQWCQAIRIWIGMWFKVKGTELRLSDKGVYRIQNKVKGQSDIWNKWNTRDMENPNSINLCTVMPFIICSLVSYLYTCAIFLSWLKVLENTDSIFCLFAVILPLASPGA